MKIRPLFYATFLALTPLALAYEPGCGNEGNNQECGPEDVPCPDNETCPSSEVGTNPINPYRGSLNRSVTDLTTFGAAPIAFTRYYNSRPRDYTRPRWELGTAWTWQHNWQYEIRESNLSDYGLPKLIVRYPEGREFYFSATDATGATRVSDASLGDRLYKTGTTTWVLRKKNGWEYEFSRVGTTSDYQYLLNYVRNGTGWRWTLTYQTQSDGKQRLYRVTNNYGRYLQINRTAGSNGYYRITSISANDGRSVSYGYSTWTPTAETVLTSVSYPGNLTATYTWAGSDSATAGSPLLASATDPMLGTSGARMKYIYNYTASYFATSPFGITVGTILEERNLVNDQVVVRLPLGSGNYPQVLEGNGTELLRKYEFGLLKQKADGEGRITTYTRDSSGAGYINQITGPDGATTSFTRDFAGRVLTRTNALGGIRTFTYNANGFPLTQQDELGRTTTHTRDASNRITRTDFPDSTYETFTYTGTGLLKTRRFRNGFTETRNYDSWGNLASLVDAAGYTWNYTYTSSGLLASITDPRNNTTSHEYDWRGNRLKTTHPDATFRTATYNAHGKVLTETDELGQTTTFTYDPYLQVATSTDPLGRTTTYEYGREPGCGSCNYLPTLSKVTLPSGKITEMHYDRSGKLLSRVIAPGTGEASTTSYTYGTDGLPLMMTDPRGKVTSYTYDALDRRLTTTDPSGHTTTNAYDAVGNVLTVTRANGSTFTRTYDAMNRQLTETNPNAETTTYTYHPDGNLATLKDAQNGVYTFTVDALSRRTRMDYPGINRYETWTYDGAGNMVQYRNRGGSIMTCTFDNRNRDTGCSWTGISILPPAVTRTYDAVGRLLTSVNANVSLAYSYDAAGQLLGETYDFGGTMGAKTVGYAYDADGNRASLTYPDGFVVQYGYTARNQIASVTAGGPPPLASYAYDASGNRLGKTLENGTTATYAYDDDGQLLSVAHANGNGTFESAAYTYDNLHRRTSQTRAGNLTDSYGYDGSDQVVTTSYGTGQTEGWSYDLVGNWASLTSGWVGNKNFASPDERNEYSNVNGVGFAYDNLGNSREVPLQMGLYQYKFDASNRLRSGKRSTVGTSMIFNYDAHNRRVNRITPGSPTVYTVYDGWNLLAEYDVDTGALLERYVHGPATDELLIRTTSTGSQYYHQDGLGSVIALTDPTGTLIERYAYTAFGVPLRRDASGFTSVATTAFASGNRFLFTGREWFPELRAYDYRNRFYSPEIGRFLQTDPIRFNAGDVNLYRYVSNNPVNWVDPLGLCCEKEQAERHKAAEEMLTSCGLAAVAAATAEGLGGIAAALYTGWDCAQKTAASHAADKKYFECQEKNNPNW